MDTKRRTRSDQASAIEFLARESHFPVGDLEQLYVNEMARLTVGARIKGFLSIFAIRNVRKILLNRSVTKLAPVKPGGIPETGGTVATIPPASGTPTRLSR
jgi:hypothetical protein